MKHQFGQPYVSAEQIQNPQDKLRSLVEQDTIKSVAIKSKQTFLDKVLNRLPRPAQNTIAVISTRVLDSQPEGLFTRGLTTVKQGNNLGALPILTLANALGLLLISLSYYFSYYGDNALEALFLPGILLMFVPNTVRLLSSAPSRLERLCLLCILGLSLYLVQFMVSPLHFSSYNEFVHWRTADDILRTKHLFSENPMLTTSPYYPGLEIFTNALSTTSMLSTFESGIIVLCISRLLMILSLFLLYEQITRSSRMAGIATIIYMTNPHFLFFDAIYNYETLALPLATFMLYILSRYGAMNQKNYPWVISGAWLVLIAITITHHMTDYVFIGILMLWSIINLFRRFPSNFRIHLVAIALFSLLLSLVYIFLLQGNPVVAYLSNYFSGAFTDIGRIIEGISPSRPLFSTNPNVPPTPIWDRLLMIASVGLVVFNLPLGWLTLWRQYHRNALAITFGIFSFAYPASQVFRFTNFGAEITDRSGAFFFLPIAYIFAIFIGHFWPTRTQKLNRKAVTLITCAVSVMFLGGVILEAGPAWSNVPGHYTVTADVRSIEPEGIQAASWSLSYLGPNNRVGTDRINRLLMLSYGDQRIVTGLDDKVDVAQLFSSSSFGPKDVALLRQANIRYLVVDQRLSTSLPLVGFYFEQGEVGSFRLTSPINKAALTKFNTVPHVNRLFDSGNLVIYDTGSIKDSANY